MEPNHFSELVSAGAGATAWHIVLKITPWAKANGGVIQGAVNWLWDKNWKPTPQTPTVQTTEPKP